jgi:hypothetical protein
MYESSVTPETPVFDSAPSANVVRAVLPIVAIGFLIALVALLVLLWPAHSSSDPGIVTSTHLGRLTNEFSGDTPITRILVDVSIYILMLIAFGVLLATWARRNRALLPILMAIGLLGIAYASGMALYTGPMISICGFSLMLFGSLVAWAASPSDPTLNGEIVQVESPADTVSGFTENVPLAAPITEPQNDDRYMSIPEQETPVVPPSTLPEPHFERYLDSTQPSGDLPVHAEDQAMIDAMSAVGDEQPHTSEEHGSETNVGGTGSEDYGSHPTA